MAQPEPVGAKDEKANEATENTKPRERRVHIVWADPVALLERGRKRPRITSPPPMAGGKRDFEDNEIVVQMVDGEEDGKKKEFVMIKGKARRKTGNQAYIQRLMNLGERK